MAAREVFQTLGTSSNLVNRFLSPVTQLGECLSYKEEVACTLRERLRERFLPELPTYGSVA
jgi:hypothetical protein